MKPYTDDQKVKLLANGRNPDQDHPPVTKLDLFVSESRQMTWLLSELNPDEPSYAFGFADLGEGFPELGDIYLPEIVHYSNLANLFLCRDEDFEAKYPMSVYVEAARNKRQITTDPSALVMAANRIRIRQERESQANGPAFMPTEPGF